MQPLHDSILSDSFNGRTVPRKHLRNSVAETLTNVSATVKSNLSINQSINPVHVTRIRRNSWRSQKNSSIRRKSNAIHVTIRPSTNDESFQEKENGTASLQKFDQNEHSFKTSPVLSNVTIGSIDIDRCSSSKMSDTLNVDEFHPIISHSHRSFDNHHSHKLKNLSLSNIEVYKEEKQKQRRRRRGGFLFSPLCIFCCCLYTFLMLAALAALLMALLIKPPPKKTSTTTTTMNTILNNSSNSYGNTSLASTSTLLTNTVSNTFFQTTAEISTMFSSVASSTAPNTITVDNINFTTTSTTTTSTTAFIPSCNTSCLNQTWLSSANLAAQWEFDGSFVDTINTYNGTPSSNQPTFTQGFVGQAVSFVNSLNQYISTNYIPLAFSSFTIDGWLYPTGYPGSGDNTIVGICPSTTGTNPCLHIVLRRSSASLEVIHFGFYGDDIPTTVNVPLNKWFHVALVFDMNTMTQSIYRNGIREANRVAARPLYANNSRFYIGYSPGYVPASANNYYQGYMDHMTVSLRAKSACEILERATLAARFTFDGILTPLSDSGPNEVISNATDYTIISGHSSQCISFTGSTTSSLKASGFAAFGITDQAFSISMWILPQILSGVLVQLSSTSSCLPLLAFSSNGSLIAQIAISSGTYRLVLAPTLLSTTSWSHIAVTWSSTNGLRLFVNNTLAASTTASNFFASGLLTNVITLGNGNCSAGIITGSYPYTGEIDSVNIFSRELTVGDVCNLRYFT